jgi:hypothetical protein
MQLQHQMERVSARSHDTEFLEGIQVGETDPRGFMAGYVGRIVSQELTAASTMAGVTCFMQR